MEKTFKYRRLQIDENGNIVHESSGEAKFFTKEAFLDALLNWNRLGLLPNKNKIYWCYVPDHTVLQPVDNAF